MSSLAFNEDERRQSLQVLLDGDWSGDILFAPSRARSAFPDALTAGEISEATRRILLTDGVHGTGDRTGHLARPA